MQASGIALLGCLFPWRRKKSSSQIAYIRGPGKFAVDVVGESFYQENLERICGKRSEEGENKLVTAALVCEDDNPKDKNAVRVDVAGFTVGYLSRKDAKDYRSELKQAKQGGTVLHCTAVIRGGWQRGKDVGHYGVKLDIPT